MLSNIGLPGIILILAIVLIIFGPKRLPAIGSAIGKSIVELKKETKNLINDHSPKKQEIEASWQAKETKGN